MAPNSTLPQSPSEYPCLICAHQSTFPHAAIPPKIGKVSIERHTLTLRTHEYDYASTARCPTCTSEFTTIITDRTTDSQIYERWRWAVQTFGNCQYVFEYATPWGTAGKWRYALFADILQYVGDESDEDDWPGYPESISLWEPDEDQEDAVCSIPKTSTVEGLEAAKEARLATLALKLWEADKAEGKLMEEAELAREKKEWKPRELAWEEKQRQRRQDRKNAEEERLFIQRYEALEKQGVDHEKILGIVKGFAPKGQERDSRAKRRKQKASNAAESPDGEGAEKVPDNKLRKDGETDVKFERRGSKAEKTATTKATKKMEREVLEQRTAAPLGQGPPQDGAAESTQAQLDSIDTAGQKVSPKKKQPATKEPKRKGGETDKQYDARMAKVERTAAAKERMKAAKIRATGQAGRVPAQDASGPSQAADNTQPSQVKTIQKEKNARPKKCAAKRKRVDDAEEVEGDPPEDAVVAGAGPGGPSKKRKRGPRKAKKKAGDPIGFH